MFFYFDLNSKVIVGIVMLTEVRYTSNHISLPYKQPHIFTLWCNEVKYTNFCVLYYDLNEKDHFIMT